MNMKIQSKMYRQLVCMYNENYCLIEMKFVADMMCLIHIMSSIKKCMRNGK